MAEDKTLEEVLMDYLKSIKKGNREGLTDEQRSDLTSILETHFDFVEYKKNEFLEKYNPWQKKELNDNLIQKFVYNIDHPDSTNDFSWLNILKEDEKWESFKRKYPEWKKLEDENQHLNMRYQIPTHFHGDIDNAVVFHCMENPRGYLGDYKDSDIDKGIESTDLEEYFGKTYKLLNEDDSSKKSTNKIKSILEKYSKDDLPDIKDIIKERYRLEKFDDEEITNIIYSGKSNLLRELDNMFKNEKDDFFEREYILNKNSKSKKPVLSEKYYYVAQYYAQLLEIDGKNLSKFKGESRVENNEECKKAREIAQKICNLEIYPFSCAEPYLGNNGIGETILLNSDLSRLGVYIVLRRIYIYLANDPNKSNKPVFVFRKYDGAWKKLFDKLFKEVGVADKFLKDLEDHFFYCQPASAGGGITEGNVISVSDFNNWQMIYNCMKKTAFTEISDLITKSDTEKELKD